MGIHFRHGFPAGLPAGVLNLVQGGRNTGVSLASHPDLDGLFFTGSRVAGAALNRFFADHPGRILALELDGKILVPMRRLAVGALAGNASPFLTPGLVDMTGARARPDEEYFGPLLQVVRVDSFAAALEADKAVAPAALPPGISPTS